MSELTLERVGTSLEDRYTKKIGSVPLNGIQALVRVLLDSRRLDALRGLRTGLLISGYEGSPLGGLDLEMQRVQARLDEFGVIFQPGVNEELAATAISGTQSVDRFPGRKVDGVTGIWYGKNPGLDRAADAIRHGNLSGTSPLGGAVAWIGDDPASKSSTVPSSCLPMCRSLAIPVLSPGTVEEILAFGLHAIEMSRYAGLWVGVQIATDVADATGVVELGGAIDSILGMAIQPRQDFSPALMIPPGNLQAELDLFSTRLDRASEYAGFAGLNVATFEPKRARLALVGSGMGHQAIVRALQEMGINDVEKERIGLRIVRLGAPWPLDSREIVRLCGGVERILVVEDKLSFLEGLVRDCLYGIDRPPSVVGKHDENRRPLLPMGSFVTADDVALALERMIAGEDLPESARRRFSLIRRQRSGDKLQLVSTVTRTPYFCSGCPHNVSTRAEPDQLVGAGIGCHALVTFDGGDRRGNITGLTQMGGEGAQWIGIAPFTEDAHFIQNIGDGTFHHSGSLAIRAAVAARVNMTYRLLYNDAVAMTGGQQPQGKLDVAAVTRLLAAEGVARIVVTTPDPARYSKVRLDPIAKVHDRDDLQEVQRELATVRGVTVIIHDDQCATEKRRMRKRGKLETPAEQVVINERVCEGCGDCGEKSTCLSLIPVETRFGRKTRVHQSSCNYDMSCLKGDCPSFMLVTQGSKPPRTSKMPPIPDALPLPTPRTSSDVTIRLQGVGGTGVVTVSAILQMAGHIDGLYTSGLDQIGLAQKGGPVVSDVRLSIEPINGQMRASAASVDVVLGLDLVGTMSQQTLMVADPERTIAILNTGVTPTAAMVTDVDAAALDINEAIERINSVTRSDENLVIDADALALSSFGDHILSNMIVVGAAYQHGCLPVSESAIEEAILLNGRAVEANLDAFRLGRAIANDPTLIEGTDGKGTAEAEKRLVLPGDAKTAMIALQLPQDWNTEVEEFLRELVAYQNAKYGLLYLHRVSEIAEVERICLQNGALDITRAYAAGLFKLMAYKDEYEVARLHLEGLRKVREEYGPGARTKVLLDPPILKSLGLKRKIRLGRTARLTFATLRSLRGLRGTALDPFGRSPMRRLERGLIREYVAAVDEAILNLTPDTHEVMMELAKLPDVVRGYEELKLKNVQRFRDRSEQLVHEMKNSIGVGIV